MEKHNQLYFLFQFQQILFLCQICFTSHWPHCDNSSQIGFTGKIGEIGESKINENNRTKS